MKENKIGINLYPHMFRQGLAIYLLQRGVSDKIIIQGTNFRTLHISFILRRLI